ncbi:MAG: PAS domain S-box protein [Bacillota bacterium]
MSAPWTVDAREAFLAGVVESAMDAIVAVDEEQKIILFNAAAERIFQRQRSSAIGQPLDLLIPERFRRMHKQHVERFGDTWVTTRTMGAGGRLELWGLRANGEEFPIDASISQHRENGRKIYNVILRDATERVRAAEIARQSEERLRGILDSAMDAIITVDESQRVVLFNKAAEAVFGWLRGEAIGSRLDKFIPSRFRAAHGEHIRRFADTGISTRRMGESRIVMGLRRNGEEFPIDASISQIAEGGQRLYTVILRDVTRRVKSDEELRRSREEIRELAMAATNAREQEKSRIARELHDELGQALTALKIDIGWLRDNAMGGDGVAEKIAAMQRLVDSTVAAARRISADLRPLMLDDLGLAAAAEWLVQNFTEHTGIPCSMDAAEEDLDLQDPHATAVFRVLQESLTNIAKHAGASQVDVKVERRKGRMAITIRDDGRGFTPQGATKPGSYGLLGVRERASLLGGEVAIESAPGRGTTVRMDLPLAESAGDA